MWHSKYSVNTSFVLGVWVFWTRYLITRPVPSYHLNMQCHFVKFLHSNCRLWESIILSCQYFWAIIIHWLRINFIEFNFLWYPKSCILGKCESYDLVFMFPVIYTELLSNHDSNIIINFFCKYIRICIFLALSSPFSWEDTFST